MFGTWTLVSFLYAGAQPEIFQGREAFVELGHFNKHLVKSKEKFWSFSSYILLNL